MNTCFSVALFWFLSLVQATAANKVALQPLSRTSSSNTALEIARRLHLASRSDNVVFDKAVTIDSGIEDFPLFTYTHLNNAVESTVQIVCTKCYIKGETSAKLTSNGDLKISSIASELGDAFNDTFHEITDYAALVFDELKDYIDEEGVDDLEDFDLPAPDIDFNIGIDEFPDTVLDVAFKDIDIFVQLSIVLSAGLTYELNLYSSKQLGIEIDSIFVGIVASIDLILSVEAEIVIDSGFHIKLDDTVGMKLALFADEATQLTFNGGNFEFLPVQVATAGVVLRAILRVGVRTGFSIEADFDAAVKAANRADWLSLGTGIEASAYANVAEFITNITATDIEALVEDGECNLRLEQGYQFAIGAAAGATVQLLNHTWGPAPETEIPIFYTALSTGCAASKPAEASASVTPPVRPRAEEGDSESVTETTVTKVTFSAFGCASPGLVNCPASLKSLSTNVVTSTLTTVVPTGADVIWPASIGQNTLVDPEMFGTNAMSMTGSSGKPSSYVPPPPTATSTSLDAEASDGSVSEVVNGETGGVNNKVIIGVSVGLGVPVIAAVIAGLLIWRRRRMYKLVDSAAPNTEELPGQNSNKHATVNVRSAPDSDE